MNGGMKGDGSEGHSYSSVAVVSTSLPRVNVITECELLVTECEMFAQDGTSKMSKSSENDLSRINLTDDADAIRNKVPHTRTA